MSLQVENACGIQMDQISNGEHSDEAWAVSSILKANDLPPNSPTSRIPKVPTMVRDTENYDKYYVPKVVSIGPYHFGNPNLKAVEDLKPVFTMKLLSNTTTLTSLYKKLGESNMVQELRNFYEEKSTEGICDEAFTKMMMLDGCFILYYIQSIFGRKVENCRELKSHQIVFVHQDLFLLENQIPFRVLYEVMKLLKNIQDWRVEIKPFINDNILAPAKQKSRTWFCGPNRPTQNDGPSQEDKKGWFEVHHLLHLLHYSLNTKDWVPTLKKDLDQSSHVDTQTKNYFCPTSTRCTFRNVNELIDVGIHFKQSESKSLADIKFLKHWWWFSADVELPPITVDDSTKPMLLNLIAYEMCLDDGHAASVTSYICLLDSLIDHPEDVKALRKAGVLDNSLGSDQEVSKLFNEIGTDLVPNTSAYWEAKDQIQKHYDSWRNTRLSQLKHEYIKSPWSFIALVGAVLALALSAVQTYFSVWSPKGECDDLCKFLKMNHHL